MKPFLKDGALGIVMEGPLVKYADGIEHMVDYDEFIAKNGGPAAIGDAVTVDADGILTQDPFVRWYQDVELYLDSTTIEAGVLPTQASNMFFTDITQTTATLNITRGQNSESLVMFMKPNIPNGLLPLAGKRYTDGGAGEGGADLLKIADGTTATYAITGLFANNTYHIQAWESNDDGIILEADILYHPGAVTGNPSSFRALPS